MFQRTFEQAWRTRRRDAATWVASSALCAVALLAALVVRGNGPQANRAAVAPPADATVARPDFGAIAPATFDGLARGIAGDATIAGERATLARVAYGAAPARGRRVELRLVDLRAVDASAAQTWKLAALRPTEEAYLETRRASGDRSVRVRWSHANRRIAARERIDARLGIAVDGWDVDAEGVLAALTALDVARFTVFEKVGR